MKKILIVALFVLIGCVPKFVIPPEPTYKQMHYYPMSGMVCFDQEAMGLLNENIQMDKKRIEELIKILEGLKK